MAEKIAEELTTGPEMGHDKWTDNPRARNLLLIALFFTVTFFSAFHEGYLPSISAIFWVFIGIGLVLSIWLALRASTKRLLSLIIGIFIVEYLKETIGIRSGLWVYQGVNRFYNFGVWAWVLAGLSVYTLSTRVVIRQIRRLKLSLPRWLNLVILLLIFSLIPLTLGKYWGGIGGLFWFFYALLLIIGIWTSIRIDFSVLLGIVVTSWFISNLSEYLGAMTSGIWTYTHNPDYPPFFLLFGCWPIEILVQYSLSAFLANEPLDKDTF